MREIKKLNFSNHPVVAKELVKFLAVNTEFHSIKDLQGILNTLQSELVSVKKEITNTLKAKNNGKQVLSVKFIELCVS